MLCTMLSTSPSGKGGLHLAVFTSSSAARIAASPISRRLIVPAMEVSVVFLAPSGMASPDSVTLVLDRGVLIQDLVDQPPGTRRDFDVGVVELVDPAARVHARRDDDVSAGPADVETIP